LSTRRLGNAEKVQMVRLSLLRSAIAVNVMFLGSFAAAMKVATGYSDPALQAIQIGSALIFGIGLVLAGLIGLSISRSIARDGSLEFRYLSKLDRIFRSVLALGGLEFETESEPNVYRYRVLFR
jgi:hypothetical protein